MDFLLQVSSFRFRVSGSGFQVSGSGFRVRGFGFRVPGVRFRVLGSGGDLRSAGGLARHWIPNVPLALRVFVPGLYLLVVDVTVYSHSGHPTWGRIPRVRDRH